MKIFMKIWIAVGLLSLLSSFGTIFYTFIQILLLGFVYVGEPNTLLLIGEIIYYSIGLSSLPVLVHNFCKIMDK